MVKTILNRLYVYIPFILMALLQNLVHEGLHFLLARVFGEGVTEFRFLTNGWLTSQVVYVTPMEARSGAHWLAIAWGPAVITTLIGYIFYWTRDRWLTKIPVLNLTLWNLGALFMLIDPLYFGVLSWFLGGSDVNAAELVGLPVWPFQLLRLAVLIVSLVLVLKWREQARGNLNRYRAQAG